MWPKAACWPDSSRKSNRSRCGRRADMKDTVRCPSTEELRTLLDAADTGQRQEASFQHLEECQGCQAKLEELATEGTRLSELVKRLDQSEPVATSAYWPAIRSL